MPFDGLIIAFDKRDLTSLLADLGIEPVSVAVLERHKADEIAKHPPSRMWRHPGLFQITGLLLTLASMMASFTMWTEYARGAAPMAGHWLAGLIPVTAVSICLMLRFNLGASLKTPARWVEADCYPINFVVETHFLYPFAVPKAVKDIAFRIATEDRDVKFVVGTLYQKTIALDPYLLVEKIDPVTGRQTRACLGVWDGDKIIHIAKV